MLGAQHFLLELQHLPEELLRLRAAALLPYRGGQGAHAPERVGMLGREHARLELQHLAEELLRLRRSGPELPIAMARLFMLASVSGCSGSNSPSCSSRARS